MPKNDDKPEIAGPKWSDVAPRQVAESPSRAVTQKALEGLFPGRDVDVQIRRSMAGQNRGKREYTITVSDTSREDFARTLGLEAEHVSQTMAYKTEASPLSGATAFVVEKTTLERVLQERHDITFPVKGNENPR